MKKISFFVAILMMAAVPRLYGQWEMVSQSPQINVPIGGTTSGYFEAELVGNSLGEGDLGVDLEVRLMGDRKGLSFANVKVTERPHYVFTSNDPTNNSWSTQDIMTPNAVGTRLTITYDLISDGTGNPGDRVNVMLLISDFGSGIGYTLTNTDVALPVKLKSFVAVAENTITNLLWETTEESGSRHFDIEHSVDVKAWTKLAETPAARESETLKNYFYSHATPSVGINYYRLKMVDADGTYSYSGIVSRKLERNSGNAISVYPNPSTDRIFLNNLTDSVKSIDVISVGGRSVRNQQGYSSSDGVDLRGLPQGMYLIKALQNSGATSTHRVVLQ